MIDAPLGEEQIEKQTSHRTYRIEVKIFFCLCLYFLLRKNFFVKNPYYTQFLDKYIEDPGVF